MRERRPPLTRSCRDPPRCVYQDLYVGLSPYSAPGIFSLLAATEITDGVWYPMVRFFA